jgi:hypothetical protein
MAVRHWQLSAACLVLPLLWACETAEDAGGAVADAGEAVVDGASAAGEAVAEGVTGAPSLVNVNLSNVLNDLSLDLNLDKVNIPVNAQIPITIAANVCGVSINILAVSTGGQANCTAKTSSPELAQVVQQQLAAGGSVGGGAQGGSTVGTSGTTATGGTSTTGAAGTTATSTGTSTTSTGTATTTQPAQTTINPTQTTTPTATTGPATDTAESPPADPDDPE